MRSFFCLCIFMGSLWGCSGSKKTEGETRPQPSNPEDSKDTETIQGKAYLVWLTSEPERQVKLGMGEVTDTAHVFDHPKQRTALLNDDGLLIESDAVLGVSNQGGSRVWWLDDYAENLTIDGCEWVHDGPDGQSDNERNTQTLPLLKLNSGDEVVNIQKMKVKNGAYSLNATFNFHGQVGHLFLGSMTSEGDGCVGAGFGSSASSTVWLNLNTGDETTHKDHPELAQFVQSLISKSIVQLREQVPDGWTHDGEEPEVTAQLKKVVYQTNAEGAPELTYIIGADVLGEAEIDDHYDVFQARVTHLSQPTESIWPGARDIPTAVVKYVSRFPDHVFGWAEVRKENVHRVREELKVRRILQGCWTLDNTSDTSTGLDFFIQGQKHVYFGPRWLETHVKRSDETLKTRFSYEPIKADSDSVELKVTESGKAAREYTFNRSGTEMRMKLGDNSIKFTRGCTTD